MSMVKNKLRELRKSRGIPQEVMGRILGTTQQTISRIENGKYDIPNDILLGAAEYFNVTTDYILNRTDIKRGLDGQIQVNKKLDDYYDFIMMYEDLNDKDRETVSIIVEHLRRQ